MWPVIDALRPSFSYLDEFAEKRGSHAHHEYLDKWLGRLRGRTVFFPYGSWAFTDRFPSGCTILEMQVGDYVQISVVQGSFPMDLGISSCRRCLSTISWVAGLRDFPGWK
jgi:hypothetical protein